MPKNKNKVKAHSFDKLKQDARKGQESRVIPKFLI